MGDMSRYLLACCLVLLAVDVTSQEKPALSTSAEKLQFALQPIGTASAPQTLTLKNETSGSLSIRGIQISGIDFAQSNHCPEQMTASQSCSIEVTFRPVVTGERLGALQLAWSGAGSPRTIPLSGTGE
jgi:hypothetical protein